MPTIVTLTLNPSVDVSTSTPRVEPVHKLRCEAPRLDPGGGGINVARVIHTLGGDCVAVYPAGGANGELLRHALEGMGVDQRWVPVAGETRESFSVDETETGQQYRFVLPGPMLSAEERRACLAAIEALTPAPEYLVVSGSYPPSVPSSFHDEILALARRIGARLVLDSSGEALVHGVQVGGLYMVKPSLHELATLVGHIPESEAEQRHALRGLVEQGAAEIVLLTLGEEGALLATARGVTRFAPIEVPEGSAVGAGDSLVGAMVLGLSRGMSLKEAVGYGMAAGAATVISPGTALCRAEDVERLFAQERQRFLHEH